MQRLGALAIVLASMAPGPSHAQAVSPNSLFGSVSPSVTNNTASWCYIKPGPANFQRTSTGRPRIAIPQLVYTPFNPPAGQEPNARYYSFQGQATLLFQTTNSGNMSFNSSGGSYGNGLKPTFSNYTQTLTANGNEQTLVVAFTVGFPLCSVPFQAIYVVE